MEWLLLSAAMNLQMVYPNFDTCELALNNIKDADPKAVCIPQGVDKHQQMLDNFFDMVDYLNSLEHESIERNY